MGNAFRQLTEASSDPPWPTNDPIIMHTMLTASHMRSEEEAQFHQMFGFAPLPQHRQGAAERGLQSLRSAEEGEGVQAFSSSNSSNSGQAHRQPTPLRAARQQCPVCAFSRNTPSAVQVLVAWVWRSSTSRVDERAVTPVNQGVGVKVPLHLLIRKVIHVTHEVKRRSPIPTQVTCHL